MRPIVFILLVLCSLSIKAQTVYKTPSGKKYHLSNCRMVKNVSEAVDLSTAISMGLGPCGICHPQTLPQTLLPGKLQGQARKTVQCNGFTKAGTRCKHMTSIANGYCYQHQPK